ncbi:MAG: hypothetical protein WC047_05110 [Kiritimatiellales bacterium]
MHDAKLQKLVTEAIILDRMIAERSARLKEIKCSLIAEATYRQEECTETEGGGKSWTAEDEDGNIARINFPAPALKDKISGIGKTIETIEKICGNKFPMLFDQAPVWKPKPGHFRKLLDTLLTASEANKVFKLCSTASSPRVSFETKEKPE